MSATPRSPTAAAALRVAASAGPFFAVELDPSGPSWTRFADFASDRDAVAGAVAHAVRSLSATAGVAEAAVDARAAASIWHLGLCARILSPAVGSAVLGGWVPELGPDALWWQGPDRQPVTLAVASPVGRQAATAVEAAEALGAGVVEPAVRPLTETVADVASVSDLVAWGNVWSALAGAAAVIAMTQPSAGPSAAAVVDAVLRQPGRSHAGGYREGGRYRRDTCCLYYRLPHGGLCGDCVLRPGDGVADRLPELPR